MKPIALLAIAGCISNCLHAQSRPVTALPSGRYLTLVEQGPARWEKGDLVLLDDKRYFVTGAPDTGVYRSSFTAQRVFFVSGLLRGAYARLVWYQNKPAIELPVAENSHNHLAATNLTAVYQQ